jgi:hypothetical protein
VTLSWVHSISQLPKCSRNHTTQQSRTTFHDTSIKKEKEGRGADGGDVSRCTSTPAQAVTVSSLWCDGTIPTAHRTSPYRYRVTNFWYVTWSRVSSTVSRYDVVTVRGNVTSVCPPRAAVIHLWENGIHLFVTATLYLVSCPMRPLGSAKNVRVQMSLSKIYNTT